MKPSIQQATRLLAVAVIASLTAAPGSATQPNTQVSPERPEARTDQPDVAPGPALQSGQVIHIDPATGRKTVPSAAQRAAGRARLGAMLSRSSDGLVETASPRSGVMVNLLGRFRSVTMLEIAPDGQTEQECSATVPETLLAEGEEADRD